MTELILSNLFDEIAFCSNVSKDDMFRIVAAGAKSKFPKSVLSLYKIIPRVMTCYPLKLVSSENITGVIITTIYNMKKNLSIEIDTKISRNDIEQYFLDRSIEVLNLLISNTKMEDLTQKKPSRRKDPIIFQGISTPLIIVVTSKKPINTYIQDKDTGPSADYVNITPGIGVLEQYGNTVLLDIHSPHSVLAVTALYGLDSYAELKQLSSVCDLDNYQSESLGKSMTLKQFITIFNNMKKHLSLSKFDM